MSCCNCVLSQGFDSCDVFPSRRGIDLSPVCNYFEKKNCQRCKKFRGGECVAGNVSPKTCGEFSRK